MDPSSTAHFYSLEPEHSALLNIRAKEPFNAEPSAAALVEFPITPEELVYCRNHGPVREFDEGAYTLAFGGLVKQEVKLSVTELKTMFGKKEVVAALIVRSASIFFLSNPEANISPSVRVLEEMKWELSRK